MSRFAPPPNADPVTPNESLEVFRLLYYCSRTAVDVDGRKQVVNTYRI